MDTQIQYTSTALTDEIVEQLKQPMELVRVKTRRARDGGVVPYISGEDAINTANRIFNFAWSSQVDEIKFMQADERAELRWNPDTQKREATGERKVTGIYYAIVSVTACYITKTDVGRCICDGNAAETHDMAIAGAVTDGLKRALRQFGDQFGNSLYDKDSEIFKEAMQGQTPAWSTRTASPREMRSGALASAQKPKAAAPTRPKFGRPVEDIISPGKQRSSNPDDDLAAD